MSVSKTFSDRGVSLLQFARRGESLTYSIVVAGGFDGLLTLERSLDGGQAWEVILSGQAAAISSTTLTQAEGSYRWRCEYGVRKNVLTGTAAITIGGVAEVILEFKDENGFVTFQIVENGVVLPGTFAVTGNSALTGDLAVTGNSTLTGTLTQTGAATFAAGVDVKASSLAIKDQTDATKVFKVDASGITAATTRTWIVPDSNDTFVGKATTDTLTNKTLTTPQITAPIIDTSLALSSIQTALTAHVGGGQDNALSLNGTYIVHQVSTVGSANDSVALPSAVGSGKIHIVINSAAANSMQVFGQLTETINGVASATGVAVAAGKTALYVDFAVGKWQMILSA